MPRLNVDFSDEMHAVLEDLAKRQHTTKADVLRRAISLGKFFQEAREHDAQILLRRKDGQVAEVLTL